MWTAIKVFIYSLTHTLGLCKHYHRNIEHTKPWQGVCPVVCPVVDRVMYLLHPYIEDKHKEYERKYKKQCTQKNK